MIKSKNFKKWIFRVGTIGNILLVFKYYWDMYTIQCEPCLPDMPCPPCRTAFMANFWTYFIIWNAVGFVVFEIMEAIKKDINNNNGQK